MQQHGSAKFPESHTFLFSQCPFHFFQSFFVIIVTVYHKQMRGGSERKEGMLGIKSKLKSLS